MASIFQISDALKTHLTRGHAHQVQLEDPAKAGLIGVSVWLYQVQFDEFCRNATTPVLNEGQPGGKRKRLAAPPMCVNLYYLVTPMTGHVSSDYDVLGRLLLTIHESPTFRVNKPELGEEDLIRISLPTDPLEERLHLWDSLKSKPYQVSFVCLLRAARLYSSLTVEEAPVVGVTSNTSLELLRN